MMDAKLTAKIVALGAMSVTVSDSGLEISEEMDAEISELIECAEDFAASISQEESDAVLLAQLTEMLDAIRAELSGEPAEDTVTITRKEYDSLTHDSDKLGCLEACGVDNWGGWDDAMELFAEGEDA